MVLVIYQLCALLPRSDLIDRTICRLEHDLWAISQGQLVYLLAAKLSQTLHLQQNASMLQAAFTSNACIFSASAPVRVPTVAMLPRVSELYMNV